MFTFDENYTFDWPVTVEMPAAGAVQRAEFTARFRLVEEDELFARKQEGEPSADITALLDGERRTMGDRLVGWSGIETPDGQPLPFSAENRDRLLRQRPIREALANAYFDAVLRRKVSEKN